MILKKERKKKRTYPASSSLTNGKDGNLRLLDGMNTVWLTNVSVHSNNSIAVPSDKGDPTLKDSVSGLTLLESFNYPCETFLPCMMLGLNTKTGEKHFLPSWKTEDPIAWKVCLWNYTPQVFIWNGSRPYSRSGHCSLPRDIPMDLTSYPIISREVCTSRWALITTPVSALWS
ncbi:unnamed protein product [Camellia sinensis]